MMRNAEPAGLSSSLCPANENSQVHEKKKEMIWSHSSQFLACMPTSYFEKKKV